MTIRVGYQGGATPSPLPGQFHPLSDSPSLTVHFSQPGRHPIDIAAGQLVEFQLSGGFIVQKEGPWRGVVAVDDRAALTLEAEDGETRIVRPADLGGPG